MNLPENKEISLPLQTALRPLWHRKVVRLAGYFLASAAMPS